jgi:regulator of protease activity HflC (stomatin/prohibitin superfamily)
MLPIPWIITVQEKSAAIIERFGKFARVASPGVNILLPFEKVSGRVSLRVHELYVNVETKTLDDVFVKITVAVQYHIMPGRIREAHYELANPQMQIESFVYDEVRAVVPKMKLDDVFQNKDEIANAVKSGLEDTMNQYGYNIVKTLVNDIDPDANVKRAMNEINAAQRIRRASEERGEAEKILRIKQAEAEAESMRLRGKGVADQRKAIVDGLRDSVLEFSQAVPGTRPGDVMQLVVMTQYFDTLKEVGAQSRSNTIMIPHSPSAVQGIAENLQNSVLMGTMQGGLVSAKVREADENLPLAPPDNSGSTTESGGGSHSSPASGISPAEEFDPQAAGRGEEPYPRTSPPRK